MSVRDEEIADLIQAAEEDGQVIPVTEETTAETKTEEATTEETTEETGTTEEETTSTTEAEVEDTLKTETETQEETTVDDTWEPNLPVLPQFNLPEPEINEDGQIINMDAQQYQQYIVERAKFDIRQELYQQNYENQSLEAAERVLPEIKTNPGVRKLVENARIASVINGNQLNSFEAAKLVKEALGIGPDKIAAAKAEGAQSAKVSIEIQKNSGVESQSKSTTKDSKSKVDKDLSRRLQRGDDDAFTDLLFDWEQKGLL